MKTSTSLRSAHHNPLTANGGSSSTAVKPTNLFHRTTQPAPATMGLPQHDSNSMKPPPRNPLHPSMIEKLDPVFVKLYNDHIAPCPPPSTDLNVVRVNYSSLYSFATAPATGVGGIGETTVPGWDKYPGDISVRVYVPPGEEPGTRKIWPVHFNFHGGGWAVGDLETSAHLCHHICATVPCCVIDIEYRLIPEYPFPIGIMDGSSAVAHILVNHKTFSIDPQNITFGGESSGATIALCLSHFFRDAGNSFSSRVKGVVVGTPSISDIKKLATPEESPWQSVRESEHMPLLNWQKMKWFDTFKWMSLNGSQNAERVDRRFSVREMNRDVLWYGNLLEAPKFEDLAPLTWIGVAEIDPLRDEAEAYAEKLREFGNRVVTKRYEGVPHPFMHFDGILKQGREYVNDVIEQIRGCLCPTGRDGDGKGRADGAVTGKTGQKSEDQADEMEE